MNRFEWRESDVGIIKRDIIVFYEKLTQSDKLKIHDPILSVDEIIHTKLLFDLTVRQLKEKYL
jgi:hypothetical protein